MVRFAQASRTLLPANQIPAGQQQLTFQPQLAETPTGEAVSIHVNVEDGRNTYVLATIPDREFVGEILTSSR